MSADKHKSRDRARSILQRCREYGQVINCKWGVGLQDKRIQAALKRGWIKLTRTGSRRHKQTVAVITEAGIKELQHADRK